MTTADYSFLDVQCFAGGFTLGAVKAGWTLAGKREGPGGFGVAACETNRHLLGHDWLTHVTVPHDWDPVPVRAVFSNPPCAGFSTLGVGQGKPEHGYGTGVDAMINQCMRDTVEFAARCEPEVVVIESVDRMYGRGRVLATELRNTLSARTRVPWTLHHVRHDVGRLGASQKSRRRYFWVATAPGVVLTVPDVPREAKAPTAWDALADLVGLSTELGPEAQMYEYGPTPWSASLRNPEGTVDGNVILTPVTNKKVAELCASNEWRGGESSVHVLARMTEEQLEALPTGGGIHAHHKERARRYNAGAGNVMTSFQLWRLSATAPAKTVDGATPRSIVHPTEPRLITLRETYRLLGFPDNWNLSAKGVWRQHNWPGKGVSPIAGEWIASAIKNSLDGRITRADAEPPERVGDDEWLWDRR